MKLSEKASAEILMLQSEVRELDVKLNALPEGFLKCNVNGHGFKYFHCVESGKKNQHSRTYISAKDSELKSALALKAMLEEQKNACLRDIENLRAYMNQHVSTENIEKTFSERPEYRRIVKNQPMQHSGRLIPGENKMTFSEWMQTSYEKNPYKPENLVLDTMAGIKVRSKSEAYILNRLFQNEIPFRYDCAVYLRNVRYYADFKILHPINGKIYYWEHFGMVDDPGYRRDMCEKLQKYIESGYIPTQNLIVTYETRNSPLSFSLVDEIISFLFL